MFSFSPVSSSALTPAPHCLGVAFEVLTEHLPADFPSDAKQPTGLFTPSRGQHIKVSVD